MIFGLNYRMWLALGALAIAVGIYITGRIDGKAIEIGNSNTEKQETINESIDIREKQSLLARPSTDGAFVDSLRGETF